MKYTNSKGEQVEISKMPDAYLLNAYVKQKKRLEMMKTKVTNIQHLGNYLNQIESLVVELKAECTRRQLL